MAEELEGTLLTFTILNSIPESFDEPLILGMVEILDGTKLICNGRCEMQELEIGQAVKIYRENDRYIFEIKG
jgi:uncharacterized OB-fold protein